VKDATPEEAWSGIKPSVSHFRVFGCLAYVHVPETQRKKLDSRSVKCMHLGLSEESKAYKLYDPEKRKIVISRDVVFDEGKSWNWSNSDQQNNESTMYDIDESEVPDTQPAMNNDTTTSDEENHEDQEITDHNAVDNPTHQTRNRRLPAHLKDFVLEDEAIDQAIDNLHNLAVYSSYEDPNNYEEAAKHEVWRRAMDLEMESIERNNT
jgi:hypothetical protein